jgi:hypothetical protein
MNIEEKARRYDNLLRHASANIGFDKALKGAESEIAIMRNLSQGGFKVEKNSDSGGADFTVICHDGRKILMEHKRASKSKYADGSLRVETQRSRNSKTDPSSRFYDRDFCEIYSIDVSDHKGREEYRFVRSQDLTQHPRYATKVKALQKENGRTWFATLREAIRGL